MNTHTITDEQNAYIPPHGPETREVDLSWDSEAVGQLSRVQIYDVSLFALPTLAYVSDSASLLTTMSSKLPLPIEVIIMIMENIDLHDLVSLSCTCKLMHAVVCPPIICLV